MNKLALLVVMAAVGGMIPSAYPLQANSVPPQRQLPVRCLSGCIDRDIPHDGITPATMQRADVSGEWCP